jgi:indolepyruvate ferredoxin oxidoreductase beta subunit
MVYTSVLLLRLNLSQYIPQDIIEEAIKMNIRRDVDRNIKAFMLGLRYGNTT